MINSVGSTTAGGDLLAGGQPDQLSGHLPADVHDRLAHRGQRRLGVLGDLDVVEADHRHVLRHPPAGLPQGAQRAVCHQVGGDEHRVQAGSSSSSWRIATRARLPGEVADRHERAAGRQPGSWSR